MKRTFAAMAAFTLAFAFTACDKGDGTAIEEKAPADTQQTETAVVTEITEAAETQTEQVSQTAASTSQSEQSVSMTFVFEPTDENKADPIPGDDEKSELDMLEKAGSPDYNADSAIPYVAWTETNLDKYMYAVSPCIGYSAALSDAGKAMIYDPGYEFHVIARTSTDYYRTDEDLYIPVQYLQNHQLEGYDPENAGSYAPAERPDVTAPAVTEDDDGGEQ
jgi:16S rRNA C1402 (ribose-2'-O) methylase RsmI